MTKAFLVFLILAGSILAYQLGEKQGFRHGVAWSEKHQAKIVSDEVQFQIKDFQRVQEIREQAEYRRGRESCGK